MSSHHNLFTASIARGHSTSSSITPPAMDRNPRASKTFVDPELLRQVALINGYPVIYGTSSSSTGSSTGLSSGWSIAGSSVQGSDAPEDWVYQLAFGTSLESNSDYLSDLPSQEEELCHEWVEPDYFSLMPCRVLKVTFYDPLHDEIVVRHFCEEEELEEAGYSVVQTLAMEHSTSSLGLADDERDDDEIVWGARKARKAAPVRPTLMRRQCLSRRKSL